jgi:nitroimidazol reductase NimA-like FMN-containing flavoprotein (pyridoxamine 5'-phosphate oxidase superfamily)
MFERAACPLERSTSMPHDTIEEWTNTQAEIEIRRWLYKSGQWAPGAERFVVQDAEDTKPLGALTQEQIDQLLRSEVVGRLGCHADGQTYVVPIIYAYKNGCIYGQSAEGKKLGMMHANPAVCFEVDHIESVTSWRSVIAWGRFEELHGDAAERATRLLLDRITPLMATTASQQPGRPTDAANAASAAVGKQRPVVYRIVLGEKSGRYEQ